MLALGIGCSSNETYVPPEVDDVASEVEWVDDLAELGVGDDEFIGDDSEFELTDEAIALLPESNETEVDEGPDLEDLTIADPDEEEIPDPPPDEEDSIEEAWLDPDPNDDGSSDPEDTGLEGAGFASALGPANVRPTSTNPAWWGKRYDCARRPIGGSCECRGSMHNCQFPNSQPGRNRYLPPLAIRELKNTKGSNARKEIIAKLGRWEIQPDTPMYDGSGYLRGMTLSSCYDMTRNGNSLKFTSRPGQSCVKVNFGQMKRMKVRGATTAQNYVYVFDAYIGKPSNVYGGGWIPRSKIKSSAFKAYNTPVRGPSKYESTAYVVKSAEDYGCNSADYASAKCLPSWSQLKIRPMSSPSVSEKARDYMLRDGHTINFAYQTPLVGGAATDTFIVARNGLRFRRAKSVDRDRPTILRIGLYKENSKKRVNSMAFFFGQIAGRNGWIAASAIKRGTVQRATPSNFCAGKIDGVHCEPVLAGAYVCQGGKAGQLLQCPAGQQCVGPNGPGAAIVCQ